MLMPRLALYSKPRMSARYLVHIAQNISVMLFTESVRGGIAAEGGMVDFSYKTGVVSPHRRSL